MSHITNPEMPTHAIKTFVSGESKASEGQILIRAGSRFTEQMKQAGIKESEVQSVFVTIPANFSSGNLSPEDRENLLSELFADWKLTQAKKVLAARKGEKFIQESEFHETSLLQVYKTDAAKEKGKYLHKIFNDQLATLLKEILAKKAFKISAEKLSEDQAKIIEAQTEIWETNFVAAFRKNTTLDAHKFEQLTKLVSKAPETPLLAKIKTDLETALKAKQASLIEI